MRRKESCELHGAVTGCPKEEDEEEDEEGEEGEQKQERGCSCSHVARRSSVAPQQPLRRLRQPQLASRCPCKFGRVRVRAVLLL
jgi:hypothetical protein